MVEPWQWGMAANGLASLALLVAAWRAFWASASWLQRTSTAFLFLALGLMHWLHAMLLALPSIASPESQAAARLLLADWRIYAFEALVGLAASVYLVMHLHGASERRIAQWREEEATRHRHAIEVQDGIVQNLVVAKLALEREAVEPCRLALEEALDTAKVLTARWLREAGAMEAARRSEPAGHPAVDAAMK